MATLTHGEGMENGIAAANDLANGVEVASGQSRPETPAGRMSLTEYSANPSTPPSERRAQIGEAVPEDFLLPDGYPDVSRAIHTLCVMGVTAC